jgi:hypothetical protein
MVFIGIGQLLGNNGGSVARKTCHSFNGKSGQGNSSPWLIWFTMSLIFLFLFDYVRALNRNEADDSEILDNS